MGNSFSPFKILFSLIFGMYKGFSFIEPTVLSPAASPISLYNKTGAIVIVSSNVYSKIIIFLLKGTPENKMFFLLVIIDKNKWLWVIYFYIKWVRNVSGWWVYMGNNVSPTHNCWQFDRTYVLPLECDVMDNRKYLLLTGNRWKSDGRWKRTILLYWEKW